MSEQQITPEQQRALDAKRAKKTVDRYEAMKAEAARLARWRKNGERGDRPATPLLDEQERVMQKRAERRHRDFVAAVSRKEASK